MTLRRESIRALKKEIYWHKQQMNILYTCYQDDAERQKKLDQHSHAIEVINFTINCIKSYNDAETIKAYEKIDHTLCLNSIEGNLKFGIDDDNHVDCNNHEEMIKCLETVKKAIG